ncbi:MAG: hypothetical protein HRU70_05715 [Phycisphaeraceae bacterium]|nr:MAG: hypothetical protein HRU70_05715 [Phycisphaeraceae bacterium]
MVTHSRRGRYVLGVVWIAGAAWSAGCAGPGPSPPAASRPEPATDPIPTLTAPVAAATNDRANGEVEELRRLLARQAEAYDRLVADRAREASALAAEAPPPAGPETTPSAGLSGMTELAPAPAPPPPKALTVRERIEEHAFELGRALRERLASGESAGADALALASLEMVRAGTLGRTDTGPIAAHLSPTFVRNLSALSGMLTGLHARPEAIGDPEALLSAVEKALEPVRASREFRVSRAVVCTRVDGYGQYEPARSSSLLAGTRHTLALYVEAEGFGHRATEGPDGRRHTVDLSMSVDLWHDADRPTLQRRWSEAGAPDTSRNVRRDFYLTSVIELPHTLSVGAYNLKVTVRDRVSGALAEAIIPITIVADPALAGVGR